MTAEGAGLLGTGTYKDYNFSPHYAIVSHSAVIEPPTITPSAHNALKAKQKALDEKERQLDIYIRGIEASMWYFVYTI